MQVGRFYIFEVGPDTPRGRQVNMIGVEPTQDSATDRARRILSALSPALIEQGWRVQVEDNHGHVLWPQPKETS